MACSLSIKQLNALRLRSAGNSPIKVTRMLTTKLQIGQLRNEVEFLVLPKLRAELISKTAFIGNYSERISPKSGYTTPSDSNSVAIVD